MSVERTFSEINKPAELYKKLYELCESLSEDLAEERYLVSMLLQFTARLKEFRVISGAELRNGRVIKMCGVPKTINIFQG